LIKQLVSAGRTNIFEDDLREQVCVILNPAAAPVLPPPVPQLTEQYFKGWTAVVPSPNGKQAWGNDGAWVSFDSAYPDQHPVTVQFQLAGMVASPFTVELNGKEVWSGQLGVNQLVPVRITGSAKEGGNVLRFKLKGEPLRPTKNNPVPRSFVVVGLQIQATN
jgi:hypothetical protein